MKSKPIARRIVATLLIATCVAPIGYTVNAAEQPLECNEPLASIHLATFDDLDFNVFTGQKWDELDRSHAADIIVHWPDGHITEGIDVHAQDLANMFVYAPDIHIDVHPIKIGCGEWTAVNGIMEGTFTQPMPTGDGNSIPPTGKAFKISMVTIGHWNEDGVIDEEWLFWDNLTFMKQMGLMD